MNQPEPNPDKIVVHIPDGLKTLIPDYLETKRQDLRRMRGFLESRDMAAIKETGHTMKGSGASYGFEELSALGAGLEAAASANDPRRVQTLLDQLADYLKNVEVVYV